MHQLGYSRPSRTLPSRGIPVACIQEGANDKESACRVGGSAGVDQGSRCGWSGRRQRRVVGPGIGPGANHLGFSYVGSRTTSATTIAGPSGAEVKSCLRRRWKKRTWPETTAVKDDAGHDLSIRATLLISDLVSAYFDPPMLAVAARSLPSASLTTRAVYRRQAPKNTAAFRLHRRMPVPHG